ncbi:MAG: tannase/feruloyl esterase family alpha/beta hydrolase [Alphaproteobacteria bacterium]|nr:tannase/feruloyl esterase family alpha/beta hydrolase [Alphaproteobacteria bacterium]
MSIKSKGLLFSTISLVVVRVVCTPSSAATCQGLAGLTLPNAAVTAAQSITSGSFTPPGSTTPLTGLPPFCRVAVTSRPTNDSIINLEVWIPLGAGWNGKYEQLGCGGFCGSINYSGLARAIGRGYASAATDDGSQAGGLATFALGHPEKIIDFGYRALKETTDKAKAIIAAFEGNGPHPSYFNGCSDGGREALQEAQRFPDDFDGIIVGSPANAWTHLFSGFIWNEQALLDDPASYIPPSLLPVLSKAAIAQCVKQDGGVPTDIFLNDPRDCPFDPASVQCTPGQDPTTCLSAAQVKAARKIYSGPHDPRTGELIFPGYEPGSESNAANWPLWIVGASRAADLSGNISAGQALQEFFGNNFFADFVFQNPNFDFHTFNFTSDVAIADDGVGEIVNSINPDLRPFKNHGGKMIHYVGWADSAIAPMNSVNYYQQVQDVLRTAVQRDHDGDSLEEIQEFYRLFMVPGMAHCGGGDGPNAFGNGLDAPVIDAEHDLLQALDRWVENGIAPDKIIATHYINNSPANGVQFQRPLCPFPQAARYNRVGDPSNANSFTCVDDEPDRDPRDQNLPPGY